MDRWQESEVLFMDMENKCLSNQTDKKLIGVILGYEDGSMEYIESGHVVVTQLFTNDDILTTDTKALNDDDSTKTLFNYGMRHALKRDGWMK